MKLKFREPSVDAVYITVLAVLIIFLFSFGIYLLGAKFFVLIFGLVGFVACLLGAANLVDRFVLRKKT